MSGCPPWALEDEMLTMRPQPASIMSGTTAWQQWNVPVRLTSRIRFHFSAVIDRNGPKPVDAGVVDQDRSAGRVAPRTSATAASSPARSVTSTARPIAVPPSASIFGGGLVRRLAVAVEHRHGDAVGGEPLADGEADARSAHR